LRSQLPLQIPLPLETKPALTRDAFIVSEANRDALAFVESWPAWATTAACLYGPAGSGKTHLAEIWIAASGAQWVEAAALSGSAFVLLDRHAPVVIENVDLSLPNPARDAAIIDLMESATAATPVLLIGREPPSAWQTLLPDLRSRFQALLSFCLWEPDEPLLRKLVRKLLGDRQLTVPETTIDQMLLKLERSPAAIREFIARVDAKALAESRAVNAALVRELLNEDASAS
jgi:chromosomal replication initiation ATPase DnaA